MAIEVGDAIWRIKGDTTGIDKALAATDKRVDMSGKKLVDTFKKASFIAGTAMTAVGGVITGFATKAVLDFVEVGSAINDMSLRTGMGTTALQELGYAAGLSGGSLDDVEKASKKMSATIFGAGEETKAAAAAQAEAWAKGSNEMIIATGANIDSLKYLGLSYQQLSSLSPEQQFMKIGFALANVRNETDRAALAQQIFGRSGTSLLPMFAEGEAGFRRMADEARRMGIIMSEEDVAAADQLGDLLDQLKASVGAMGKEVAKALVPALIELANSVKETAIEFNQWRAANPELADSLIKIAVGAGAIMFVLGPLLIALPSLIKAWGTLKWAVTAVSTAVTALAAALGAPVELVVAAIALIGVAAYMLYQNWAEVKQGLVELWTMIKDAFFFIWSPIIDAIKWLADTGLSVLNKVGGWMGIGGGPTMMASGGTVNRSGWAVVGEQGPELVSLPQGATVYDAQQTARATAGGSQSVNMTLNFNKDSVRSDQDIRDIARELSRLIGSGMTANGVRVFA